MQSFKTLLKSVGLLHIFDNLPVTTQLHDLMKHLVDLCVQAGVKFPDAPGRRSLFSSEEILPIELLGFSSNGHINNSARTPRLTGIFVDGDMTLADVVGDTRRFAIARHVVTSGNRFLLHFGTSQATQYSLSANKNHAQLYALMRRFLTSISMSYAWAPIRTVSLIDALDFAPTAFLGMILMLNWPMSTKLLMKRQLKTVAWFPIPPVKK